MGILSGKRILITGATGYIGSKLIQSLKGENELFCTFRNSEKKVPDKKVEWMYWDMVNKIEPEKLPKKLDIIAHLAMNPAKDPEKRIEAFKINTMRTLELLEYGKKIGIQTFLYTSSGSVYGYGRKSFSENDPVSINDFYTLTRYESELLIRQYCDHFNTVILRYFVPYGPGQTGKLVPNLIKRVKNGEEVVITNEGNPITNPIYITDLIEVTIRALSLSGPSTINVGGMEALSISNITTTIGQILGKKPVLNYVNDPTKIGKDLVGDIAKMRDLLSYTPKVSFKYGIKNVVEHCGGT
jgi:nucleoside-diphosphate-sugar epimerase